MPELPPMSLQDPAVQNQSVQGTAQSPAERDLAELLVESLNLEGVNAADIDPDIAVRHVDEGMRPSAEIARHRIRDQIGLALGGADQPLVRTEAGDPTAIIARYCIDRPVQGQSGDLSLG